jgi:hypothetical protein
MNYIGALAIEGKTFNYRTNERLHKALELKLFEDQKDSIKLKNLVSSVVDKDTQEKIDIVKDRMIKSYGYCEICSTDVLNFVASIFARGDAKDSNGLASPSRLARDFPVRRFLRGELAWAGVGGEPRCSRRLDLQRSTGVGRQPSGRPCRRPARQRPSQRLEGPTAARNRCRPANRQRRSPAGSTVRWCSPATRIVCIGAPPNRARARSSASCPRTVGRRPP